MFTSLSTVAMRLRRGESVRVVLRDLLIRPRRRLSHLIHSFPEPQKNDAQKKFTNAPKVRVKKVDERENAHSSHASGTVHALYDLVSW